VADVTASPPLPASIIAPLYMIRAIPSTLDNSIRHCKPKLVTEAGAHRAGAAAAAHCQLHDSDAAFKLLRHGALLLMANPNPAQDTISSCAKLRAGSGLIAVEERCR
jgi:hypothetical protein